MALEIIFWVAVGLIVYAHLGYPLLLWALVAIFGERDVTREPAGDFPTVSLIVPAHDEAIRRLEEDQSAADAVQEGSSFRALRLGKPHPNVPQAVTCLRLAARWHPEGPSAALALAASRAAGRAVYRA